MRRMKNNRRKMTSKGSKRLFKKTAQKVHPKNDYRPMRGGIRL